LRKVDKIIVHCSDSDVNTHDDISIIKEWHLKRRFKDVGYHYFIKKNGDIQQGRSVQKTGAHCYKNNQKSIGICLSGRHEFTDEQFSGLSFLCKLLCDVMGINEKEIYPHNYFNSSKSCPNFEWEKFK